MLLPLLLLGGGAGAVLYLLLGDRLAARAGKPLFPPAGALFTKGVGMSGRITGVPDVLLRAHGAAGLPPLSAGIHEQTKAVEAGADIASLTREQNELLRSYIRTVADLVGEDAPLPGSISGTNAEKGGPGVYLGFARGGLGGLDYYRVSVNERGEVVNLGGIWDSAVKVAKKGGRAVERGARRAGRAATSTARDVIQAASDPVGTAKDIARGAVGAARSAAGAAGDAAKFVYRVGKDIYNTALHPQRTLRRGQELISSLPRSVSRVAERAWDRVQRYGEDAIRAVLRTAVAPLGSALKASLDTLAPSAVAIGGAAALARVFGGQERWDKLIVTRKIALLGAKPLVKRAVDQIPVPGGVPRVGDLWRATRGPMESVLSETLADLAVAVGSGKIEEAAATIAGVGVLSPVSLTLAKVQNLIIGLALQTAVGTATRMGKGQIVSMLADIGVGTDPVSREAVNLMFDTLRSPIPGLGGLSDDAGAVADATRDRSWEVTDRSGFEVREG